MGKSVNPAHPHPFHAAAPDLLHHQTAPLKYSGPLRTGRDRSDLFPAPFTSLTSHTQSLTSPRPLLQGRRTPDIRRLTRDAVVILSNSKSPVPVRCPFTTATPSTAIPRTVLQYHESEWLRASLLIRRRGQIRASPLYFWEYSHLGLEARQSLYCWLIT